MQPIIIAAAQAWADHLQDQADAIRLALVEMKRPSVEKRKKK